MVTAFWEDQTLFGPDLFHASERGHALFAAETAAAFEAAYRIALRRRAAGG